jgi:pimeloyl-ACP methyl ester carboxylesterase
MARPDNKLLYTDILRASGELFSLPFAVHLALAPKGDGHPILFLPGFFGGDLTTHIARRYFRMKGYRTYGWGLGTNFGPSEARMEKLVARFKDIYEKNGQKPISIVGHSLGGLYARELAKTYPEMVRRVITLGTPIVKIDEGMDELRAAFEFLNPQTEHLNKRELLQELADPPPVETTVIYTKLDGIVHYRSCKQPDPPDYVENIVVPGSHCGLIVNAQAFHIMVERLVHNPEQDKKSRSNKGSTIFGNAPT